VSIVLVILYPFWVYFAVSQGWSLLALVPILLGLAIKYCQATTTLAQRRFWILTALLLSVAVWLNQVEQALLYYPVWVNAGMLWLFASSLWFPPSIVERIASLMEGPLPESGRRYTRRVTQVWCGFFICNGSTAAWLAWLGNWQWWTWYNGAISYVLMGTLMGVEYLIRQRVRRHEQRSP